MAIENGELMLRAVQKFMIRNREILLSFYLFLSKLTKFKIGTEIYILLILVLFPDRLAHAMACTT